MRAKRYKKRWFTMLKKVNKKVYNECLLKFFSKLKNAEGMITAGTVKTSSKYSISSIVCVGLLYLLHFLVISGLLRIELI